MEINHHNDRLLIIGGTGFIGQYVVKTALEQGFNTTVLSKNNQNISIKLEGVVYLTVDISHKESLLAVLEGKVFDYVINLGGYVNHINYSDGGNRVFDAHFNGVRNLVDCLDRPNIKKFIQIGSSDEYGNNPAPQFESQREAPVSPYSCAKVASTYFLQALWRSEKFPAVILRPFLVYGPGQGKDRLIPQIIKGCMDNRKFPTSKGEQLRDFCFIDDFISAIFLALNNNNIHGEVLNISSGRPVSIKKIINVIVGILGSGQPQFGRIDYRNSENMMLYGDISKAKNLLGWNPCTDLRQGILKTIGYFEQFNNE